MAVVERRPIPSRTSARQPSAYVSREDLILKTCISKRVLHLGCIGQTEAKTLERVRFFESDLSLHSRLSQVASDVVGVDIDEDIIGLLKERGFDKLYAGDAEHLDNSDLPQFVRFEIVVAGDLIEHLGNPGLMLAGIRSVLEKDGQLLVTAPNAFGLPNLLRFGVGRYAEGNDHLQSYSYFTLRNLLERYGWVVIDAYTCFQSNAKDIVGPAAFAVGRRLLEWQPKWGGTLLVICEQDETRVR